MAAGGSRRDPPPGSKRQPRLVPPRRVDPQVQREVEGCPLMPRGGSELHRSPLKAGALALPGTILGIAIRSDDLGASTDRAVGVQRSGSPPLPRAGIPGLRTGIRRAAADRSAGASGLPPGASSPRIGGGSVVAKSACRLGDLSTRRRPPGREEAGRRACRQVDRDTHPQVDRETCSCDRRPPASLGWLAPLGPTVGGRSLTAPTLAASGLRRARQSCRGTAGSTARRAAGEREPR